MTDPKRLRSALALALSGAVYSGGCGPNPKGSEPVELEFSGGTSSGARGGTGGSSARGGQGGSSAGTGGRGGSGGSTTSAPPRVTSMDPTSGPYGTRITISGQSLGGASVQGSRLLVGDTGEVALTPDSDAVESWSETSIVFRCPFPATGAVSVETDEGAALAGEFDPTWISVATFENAPAASVIASLSHAPGSVFLLLDTTPPTLLELGPDGVSEYAVALGGALASSVRLYLDAEGALEGIALNGDSMPELVHLENASGDLVGRATGIQAETSEIALAGGPDGACAWMNGSAGWVRARPGAAGWAEDEGPVAEPDTEGDDRAFGATSDGSLYVAWSVDSGTLLDDMQSPVVARFAPGASDWSGATVVGSSIDDYVTSLDLYDEGRGMVIRYCGSDVDTTGLSETGYMCFDAVFSQEGANIPELDVDTNRTGYAFSAARAVVGACGSDDAFGVSTDQASSGEAIVYPCQTLMALEVDPDGEFVPVVRDGTTLHVLGRRQR